MKGLKPVYAEDEDLEKLQARAPSFIRFLKVSKFQTTNSKMKGINLLIYLIHLLPDSNSNNVKVIKAISHQLIKWKKLIKKDLSQCKRCQIFGHAAGNCHLPFRCIKRSDTHAPGECAALNISKENIYCVNCKQYGHPASYKGCPKIKDISNLFAQKNSKNNKIEKIKQAYNNLVVENKSFATVLKSNIKGMTP